MVTGAPNVPVPSPSCTDTEPGVVWFVDRMSALPSLLKSATPTDDGLPPAVKFTLVPMVPRPSFLNTLTELK